MAIRHWHPGKLILIWLVCGIPACVLIASATRPRYYVRPFDFMGPEYWQAELARYHANVWMSQRQFGFALLLLGTALIITWRWFGARDTRP
jgi:hypothetical protein